MDLEQLIMTVIIFIFQNQIIKKIILEVVDKIINHIQKLFYKLL